MSVQNYADFLVHKTQAGAKHGFAPTFMPDFLFDFQKDLVTWAVGRGRAAIFADCGLGKTPMALVWAQNVLEHTNQSVLILTPLAVGAQFVAEGEKFGIPCLRSRDGKKPATPGIIVTNYEQLHHFQPDDFAGVVCDEASILKHFTGATQAAVTRFMLKTPYRLLCTATAAPNDYIELGTLSEALGELGYSDMLTRFFKQADNKYHRRGELEQHRKERNDPAYFEKLAYRTASGTEQWRLKGHAVQPFWRWVASWARACRKPSDLGYDDGNFVLPPLIEKEHVIKPNLVLEGMLFELPALGLQQEREERRRTLQQRCEYVASLVDHSEQAVVWCHLNDEGNVLEKIIPGATQVSGADDDEEKECAFQAFKEGTARVLVSKPKVGAWGLNWQHCNHVVTFSSHSFEQYYQSVRRCWRFGQQRAVTVDIIATEGEKNIQANLLRKARAADVMFSQLVAEMRNAQSIPRQEHGNQSITVPSWLL